MTQFSLKMLALICMLCDHGAKVVLSTGVLTPLLGIQGNLWLYTALTVIGRIAFPIFAWFVAEGCRRTKVFGKYLLRLFVFALLSEIPFQLCFYGTASIACHNVIFTMLLGALGIFAGKWLEEKGRLPARLIPALIVIVLGWLLYTDYNAWGVALILFLYYLPEKRSRLLFLSLWLTLFYLLWHGWSGSGFLWLQGDRRNILLLQWLSSLTSVLLLSCYHGEQGRRAKWLFYGFYPIHLTLFYGLRLLIG